MPITLDELNAASVTDALNWIGPVYEHSPWIAESALRHRPFLSLAHLKQALVQALAAADRDHQLALICAHPELAGKAMVAGTLTTASTGEQNQAGLTQCPPDDLTRLQELNAAYRSRFGWPFVLAVRGPRGIGLQRHEILETFQRRIEQPAEVEFQECIRQIHRIAELRLNDLFGHVPQEGQQVWDALLAMARHNEPEAASRNELTVTYLTPAHQACAREWLERMRQAGMDEVHIDAVGNVVGRYHPAGAGPYLLTGSHYDTVRNAGRFDGRMGIAVALAAVSRLHQRQQRLSIGVEVVAFAEEEGQRYKATFLGSSALVGRFNPDWLDQRDEHGTTMREAMQQAGLPGTLDAIASCRRAPEQYLGFVEVHVEQGPVLSQLNLPLGVVSAINGSVRYTGEVLGLASHAGTTPMTNRQDAALAVAELALYAEQRALQDGPHSGTVATVGQLSVPQGSINVVPGRCVFSLDIRSPDDGLRDRAERDVLQHLCEVCQRRGVRYRLAETLRIPAAPCAPEWTARWARAVAQTGLSVHHLPSGAGHDAMKLHELLPQGMLFVRGENGGISHNPLESTHCDDLQLAVDSLSNLLLQLAEDTP
jgi:N-carbamoyl-L-amino-acid hydrolase